MVGPRGCGAARAHGAADAAGGLVLRPAARRRALRGGRVGRAWRRPRSSRRDRLASRTRLRPGAARLPAARGGRRACRPASLPGRTRSDRRRRRGARRGAIGRGTRAGHGPRGVHARSRGHRCGDPHVRHQRLATADRVDLRQLPVERPRLSRRPRPGSRGALAVRAAAVARRRALDHAALGDLRDHRRRARAFRVRARPACPASAGGDHREPGRHHARPPPRRGPGAAAVAALRADRRRTGAGGARGACPRRRRAGQPDLRPDRGLLAGDDHARCRDRRRAP